MVAQSIQRQITAVQALPSPQRPDAWQRLIASLEEERQQATEPEHRHAAGLWLLHIMRLRDEDDLAAGN
jgi:hypothetical protein